MGGSGRSEGKEGDGGEEEQGTQKQTNSKEEQEEKRAFTTRARDHGSNEDEADDDAVDDEDDDDEVDLDFSDLDITSVDFDFDDMEEHMGQNMENEVVKQALEQGIDLRVYARQVEKDLELLERESIQDYMKEAKRMAQLHQQVRVCDGILQNMERMLSTFQSDLGNIGGEIQSLQEESLGMSVKLKNRRTIQDRLSDFVSNMALSAELVDSICSPDPTITPQFEAAVGDLHRKLAFVSSQPETTVAVADVHADLTKLKSNAVAKIKDVFLGKIHSVRKPMSNLQNVQQALLKHSDCFDFLVKHSRLTAAAVKDEYVDTVSKIHFSYVKTYISRLMKLQFDQVPDKEDVLAADDSAGKRGGGLFSSRPVLKNRSTTFTLGNRGAVLQSLDAPILVPHAQDAKALKDTKFTYEQLFRSFQKALIDTGVREYLFSMEFFGLKEAKAADAFSAIMGKAIGCVLKHVECYLSSCYDGICVMLCIRINAHFRAKMHEQSITCIDSYLAAVDDLLLKCLHSIIALNTESVRHVDPEKFANVDTRPHFIVRRYAEYSGAILGLNEDCKIESIDNDMQQLSTEVEGFILRLAAEFPDRREQLIFLINNYDLLVSVLARRTSGESTEAHAAHDHLKARIHEFALIVLAPKFGGIINFVKKVEQAFAKDDSKCPVPEATIQKLIQSFAQTWKSAIDDIDRDVMLSFTNFKNGRLILQEALTQLVVYYEKFLALLKKPALRRAGGWPDLVDRHHLLVEVKKHKATF
ncbi:hypothetical protein PTSG_06276 [Salpingoeca rosetta]|uniref:Vacuolar protein sorting-associated protein 52 homolog n=1 Tax=Salpingoeca rosetta (strain ATCC 50818 / BSB-021) TaxID=946362 RepID=F2UCG0_SALR5|nr:uncharacterized protein PTSG_06276 [Salpingoeca rosetta]EGD74267.1 hypothetical protein PTSG_06276 [Salpingoeca rosetta]|eukprot:XP_004993167.1 hypothetical protein PTSG_06276 [Salpingoeca rosetta]